jgi:3-dehydroquinate synthase
MSQTIHIQQQSSTYPVHIARDLLGRTGSLVKSKGRVFVITSTALQERFGERVASSFAPRADVITIEEGESHKTLETANAIVTQLLERGAKRDSTAVVVGGGMIGDTAGFAAAIFLRGIALVHVPTTLLAQVDSSLGGKVAVNHPKGKNLIGAFHPPRAVIADLAALDSLPRRELLSGMFEALKGGVIGDPQLYAMFEDRRMDLAEIVPRAVRVKAEIVSADEREADVRRLLNYGHTIAHGIETAMSYEGITHGEAVAWGMIAANAIAVRRGILDKATRARIDKTILAYEPFELPRTLDRAAILAATEHDKKNTGDTRVMVLPRMIGKCEIVTDITEDDLEYGISAVLG